MTRKNKREMEISTKAQLRNTYNQKSEAGVFA
jgi:hypothetical protein